MLGSYIQFFFLKIYFSSFSTLGSLISAWNEALFNRLFVALGMLYFGLLLPLILVFICVYIPNMHPWSRLCPRVLASSPLSQSYTTHAFLSYSPIPIFHTHLIITSSFSKPTEPILFHYHISISPCPLNPLLSPPKVISRSNKGPSSSPKSLPPNCLSEGFKFSS